MRIIAILSQKGGAGKTTIAVNLAVAAELAGKRSVIVDLDPQASSTSWGDSRRTEAPAVVSAQASRLPNVLEAASNGGAELAIIDTAPHSESVSLAAARLADFILIPCRPAILDLRAINHTIELVRLAAKPAAVILIACRPEAAWRTKQPRQSKGMASRSHRCRSASGPPIFIR
jgi:chromosome partitioning protein